MSGRHRVFVYGTLRPGGSNHHRMAGARWLGSARVRGRLYAVVTYPALKLDEQGDWVEGDVFEMDDRTLQDLDAFEGDEYERVRVEPEMTDERMEWDDSQSWAWVWQWRGSVEELVRIPMGDWLEYYRPSQRPWWASMGCLGVLAIPSGGMLLLEFGGRWKRLPVAFEGWTMGLLFFAAGLFGFYSMWMSIRMREFVHPSLVSCLTLGTCAAAAACLLVSIIVIVFELGALMD